MSRKVLTSSIKALTDSVEDLFQKKRYLPGLILLYSSMDIMASLDRPEHAQEVQAQDFIRWVRTYMLRKPAIEATAEDLYSARCGLVHTYTPQSKLSRRGRAREVYYAWGPAKPSNLQEASDAIGWQVHSVTVHADELLAAFQEGVREYLRTLSEDHERARLAYGRAAKFFGFLPVGLVDLTLRTRRRG